jgi:hypothetical protein
VADLSIEEIYEAAIKEIDRRYRFPAFDDLINGPTDMEKQVAMEDAVGDINAYAPVTTFTLEGIFNGKADVRLKNLVYLGTARNVIRTLLFDWTANGVSATVEEFTFEDRKDRYEQLLTTIDGQFDKLVSGWKESSQKFSHRIYLGNSNPLARFRSSPPFQGAVRLR